MHRSTYGIVLSLLSLSLWIVDRTTYAITHFLGEYFCDDRYLQAVDGVVGDISCGFNIDMYLSFSLLLLFILGILLYISSKKLRKDK